MTEGPRKLLIGAGIAVAALAAGIYHCSQTVRSKLDRNKTIVSIGVEDGRGLQSTRERLDRDGFMKTIPLTISSTAALFVAGPSTQPTTAQLAADAYDRAARGSRDGIGDALAALPPSQHVVLFEIGGRMIKIDLEPTVFTVDLAMTYAEAVAKRVRE